MITLLSTLAAAQELRTLSLDDGRTLVARVVSQSPDALEIVVPQGAMTIPYTALRGLEPAEAATYASQGPWIVIVVGDGALAGRLRAHFDAIEGVDAPMGFGDGVDPSQAEAAARCAGAAECVATALEGAPWRWVVGVRPGATGSILEARPTSGGDLKQHALVATDDATVWALAHRILQLRPSAQPAPVTLTPIAPETPTHDAPTPWTEARVASTAWIPVPGLAAMRQRDPGHAAVAVAFGVPAAAAAVAIAGATARSPEEGIVWGTLGAWLTLAAVNEITGQRARTRAERLSDRDGVAWASSETRSPHE